MIKLFAHRGAPVKEAENTIVSVTIQVTFFYPNF